MLQIPVKMDKYLERPQPTAAQGMRRWLLRHGGKWNCLDDRSNRPPLTAVQEIRQWLQHHGGKWGCLERAPSKRHLPSKAKFPRPASCVNVRQK